MTRSLRCRDLQAGDVLLKLNDGSLLSGAIEAGQRLTGGRNAQIVHAGMLFDRTFMIEAQGSGLTANDLRVQNKAYGYYVFRCTNANIARGAGTCAKLMFDIHRAHGSLKFSIPGAIGSLFGGRGQAATPAMMDDLLTRILEGRSQGFFCSQFVVYVYQFVAAQSGAAASSMFRDSDAKVAPTRLARMLAGHHLFREVGALFPNER